MSINDLVRDGRLGDVFILARYLYRIGEPIIEDALYDKLEGTIRQHYFVEYKDYLCRSYDDDPVPYGLLQELGLGNAIVAVDSPSVRALEEDKSNSIRPVRDWEEAYNFMMRNRGRKFVLSTKIDGVNGKSLYLNGEFAICLSRGRKGNSIDYSVGASVVVRGKLPVGSYLKEQRITGEFFVDPKVLDSFRDKYDAQKYKTAKSAAISMLRVKHDDEDYTSLKFRAFYADGDYGTVAEMYDALQRMGFEVPPFMEIKDFPEDKLEFKDWLFNGPMKELQDASDGIPSDGLVLEVNNLHDEFKEENQYSERQLALKFGHWDFGYEQGIITDILIQQRRVLKSVRITIEQMKTKDGCNATFINSYNPSILIKNDLYVGKPVYFEKNSGAVNVLIHGERMHNIINASIAVEEYV